MRVFIIYDRQDSEIARSVAHALTMSGYSVWIDFPIYEGSWEKEIRPAMEDSQLIIAVWTPAAGNSRSVQIEWDIARRLSKRIILISIEGSLPDEIPEFSNVVNSPTVEAIRGLFLSYLKSNRGHSIFISYSKEDAKSAERLLELINQSKHQVWLDRFSLDPGMDFPLKILRGIERCNYLFLVWSRHAERSTWVEREWNYALNQSKEIVPVLLDSTPLPSPIEHINGFRGIDEDKIRSFLGIVKTRTPEMPINSFFFLSNFSSNFSLFKRLSHWAAYPVNLGARLRRFVLRKDNLRRPES